MLKCICFSSAFSCHSMHNNGLAKSNNKNRSSMADRMPKSRLPTADGPRRILPIHSSMFRMYLYNDAWRLMLTVNHIKFYIEVRHYYNGDAYRFLWNPVKKRKKNTKNSKMIGVRRKRRHQVILIIGTSNARTTSTNNNKHENIE